MAVTAQQVADLIGRGDDTTLVALAGQVLPVVTAQIRAYTRGRGFSGDQPTPELEAVILTSAARAISNPEQLRAEEVGDWSRTYQVTQGWTLAEHAILGRYRVRAR